MILAITGILAVAAIGGLAAFAVLCVRHACSDEFMHPDAVPPSDGLRVGN